MTTIVERDRALADLLNSTVGQNAFVLDSLDQLRGHLEERADEYAVVLGPSIDLGAAVALADHMRLARPALSVILVRRRVDTAVLAEALRAGMREVVEDRDLTGVAEAVRRAYVLYQALTGTNDEDASRTGGRLVTVFSSKGGVGKSMLATNLAAALAQEGRRVCLIDLDLSYGDAAIMMQLYPSNTIADAVTMHVDIDPAGLESLVTPHSDGLALLAAPVQPDARDSIPPEVVGRLLRVAKSAYDVVVVDTSPVLDEFALHAFDNADLLLLIGTLDIPSLKGLKLSAETLDLLNIPRSRWRVVLNRSDSKVLLSPDEVEKTLGMPISCRIPSSRDVPSSINRGDLIVRSQPRHPVSRSIQALATHVWDATTRHSTPGGGSAAAPDGKRGSRLRRKVRAA
ncbi:MAG: AAA family ATPase [Actinomycetota bacterium]|nr:AAA family ATPase [Actinomycetota bacterium]